MVKAWLVRPKPEGKDRMTEFLDSDIVAIGWPEIGSLEGLDRTHIRQKLVGPPCNYTSLELGNALATIDIFVNQMSINDYVLVPHGDDIYFGIIKSNYKYDDAKEDDGYPHQRDVTWLAGPIARTQLPIDLRKSLKVHRTTADLSHHVQSIINLAEGNEIVEATNTTNESFVVAEYPLRPGLTIQIKIPQDITQNEASRLGDFVKTLYFHN